MVRSERALMWVALAGLLLLATLSATGAFLGAARAGELFASVPLAAYWMGLAVLPAVGLVCSRRLRSRPALAGMHVACILIVAGGMWGSDKAHHIRERLFGEGKAPKGYMVIAEGASENRIMDRSFLNVLGRLPFDVKLEEFRVERYPCRDDEWKLVAVVHRPGPTGAEGEWQSEPIEWKHGKETDLPFTNGRLRVLRYLPRVAVKSAGELVTIPVLEMEVNLEGESRPVWMAPYPGEDIVRLPLSEHFADVPESASLPTLVLVGPKGEVSDYKTSLTVLEEGKPVARKVIEVNKPLHYGGYHFYQHDYDRDGKQYTVLMVVSDTGLVPIYVGFVLLVIGSVWHFWIRPAWTYVWGVSN